MLAARCGALKAMDALISAYARLDATDRQGMTALLIAINCNRRQAAHLLLERSASRLPGPNRPCIGRRAGACEHTGRPAEAQTQPERRQL